eukprot:CAMPEP_0115382078 /NCGR_PEP_ID=MMETSP0271-20121206/5900_1 /TAXON_ID=71861 /ORGANISM="Scrippsiella trochoidea, Strain CCMP3099" /LENGTH=101 /DNA_ID=CAMNT_0002805377 /DNA_START=332 /DNA_END=634 /DNA_ORIENTATION=-
MNTGYKRESSSTNRGASDVRAKSSNGESLALAPPPDDEALRRPVAAWWAMAEAGCTAAEIAEAATDGASNCPIARRLPMARALHLATPRHCCCHEQRADIK